MGSPLARSLAGHRVGLAGVAGVAGVAGELMLLLAGAGIPDPRPAVAAGGRVAPSGA